MISQKTRDQKKSARQKKTRGLGASTAVGLGVVGRLVAVLSRLVPCSRCPVAGGVAGLVAPGSLVDIPGLGGVDRVAAAGAGPGAGFDVGSPAFPFPSVECRVALPGRVAGPVSGCLTLAGAGWAPGGL
jgi:hypothetical protein